MLKVSFTIILLSQFYFTLCAQKKLTINLIADSTINTEFISCRIDNGKKDLEYNRTTHRFIKDTLKISIPYFSEFATINIEHSSFERPYTFFINSKKANFYISIDNKNDVEIFLVKAPQNASLVYDTVKNQVYKNLFKYTKVEREELNYFMLNNSQTFWKNDSLKNIYNNLLKIFLNKELGFLNKHTDKYFTFWYFNKNIVGRSKFYLPKDTFYLAYLRKYFLENFPNKFLISFEGKKLLKEFDFKFTKIVVGDKIPKFILTDTKNNIISINDSNNDKYVLLHIWATWCGPCKAQFHDVSSLNNEIVKSKLEMISICAHSSIENMKKDIEKYKMTWVNVYDEYGNVGDIFNTSFVPTYILINKDKRIEYLGNNIKDVIKIINANLKL